MVDSYVCGFHVYQDIWTPATGERFSCQMKESNAFDLYAVAIRKSANVFGHVPCKISAVCSLFIQRESTLYCIIPVVSIRQIYQRAVFKYPANLNSSVTM